MIDYLQEILIMNVACKLNDSGMECYKNNQKSKKIPLDHEMEIVDLVSYDSGRAIYLIRSKINNKLQDYYFENDLIFSE